MSRYYDEERRGFSRVESLFAYLPLDTKIVIGGFSTSAWIRLSFIDKEFNKYAVTYEGIRDFIRRFAIPSIHANMKIWKLFGYTHRGDDLPAIEYTNGTVSYYHFGNLHRVGKPAMIKSDGSILYYHCNKLHRRHGPAVISADGTLRYYNKGELHRVGGPAIIYPNGGCEYYHDGYRIGNPI